MPLHERWSKFCDSLLDEEHASSRIPLPGEYIVVEMHPWSLLWNLNGSDVPSKLKEKLLNYPFRKYCAVVYKVRGFFFSTSFPLLLNLNIHPVPRHDITERSDLPDLPPTSPLQL